MPSTDEFVAEVTGHGRVTIPSQLHGELGLDDADVVRFVRTDDGAVCLQPADRRTGDADATADGAVPDDDPDDADQSDGTRGRRRADSPAAIQS